MLRSVFVLVFFTLSLGTAVADVQATLRSLAPNGLILVVDETGKTLVSQNADTSFVPASVAKIVTAALALDTLGPDYRFKTDFYIDAQRTLYIRGSGDPFWVSEEIALLVPQLLKATGTKPFSGLVLDTRHYPSDLRLPGIKTNREAYNALNAALAANFNTIHAVKSGNTVQSAETQTPITPIAIDQMKARGPKGRGRISLDQNQPALSALYAGELLAAFIRQSGGDLSGEIKLGPVPNQLRPIYRHHQSRPLSDIVGLMLLGSNNFIANQLFLEVGAQKYGSPVSLKKSLAALSETLKSRRLASHITLLEGSGISKESRMTPQGLVSFLDRFAPYATLMRRSKRGSYYKTGTLDTVSTLAGFARTQKHGLVRFVIALPGRTGKLRFRLLGAIETHL